MNKRRNGGNLQNRLLALMTAAACVPVAALSLLDCNANDDETVVDAGPEPPRMLHGAPNEGAGELCVVCHSCGSDGTSPPAPVIDNRSHAPCAHCHEPDGTVVFHGDAACEWEMDCTTNPPVVNCIDCHTVAWVNDLCENCHVQ